jgi:hypothetical protein
VQKLAHSQHSGAVGEAVSSAGDADLKVQDITKAFGTQKDKAKVCLCPGFTIFLFPIFDNVVYKVACTVQFKLKS